MDTTQAQNTATRLRAIADFLDAHPDLPAPDVEARWHLMWDQAWRTTVRTITDALDAQWVATHSGSSHWLQTTVPTSIGNLTIFVPEEEPRQPVNPDLSEFTVAGRRAAAQT
jgi:hypothetical protein